MKKGDIVTVPLEPNNNAANTYIIYEVLEHVALLRHPLNDDILIAKPKPVINTVAPNVKDSMERGINYILQNKDIFDFNSLAELEAIILYFIVHRKLSNRQKQTISNLCGAIAEHYFNDDISLAIKYINENSGYWTTSIVCGIRISRTILLEIKWLILEIGEYQYLIWLVLF